MPNDWKLINCEQYISIPEKTKWIVNISIAIIQAASVLVEGRRYQLSRIDGKSIYEGS